MSNEYLNKDLKNEKDKIDRPYLIYRMFAAILDFITMLGILIGCFLVIKVCLFNKLGYKDTLNNLNNYYESSSLFVKEGEIYSEYSFDESTFESLNQIDTNITYFYSNNEFAITDNKLTEYNTSKVSNNITTLELEELSTYYQNEYDNAVSYFKQTDTYITYNNKLNSIIINSFVVSFMISSLVTYLVIPLLLKTRNTLSQYLFKLYLVNNDHHKLISKFQVVLRYLAHISVNFLTPIVLFIYFNIDLYYCFTPFIVNIFLMCLTKSNSNLTDYISNSSFVNKSYYEKENH